VWFSNVAEANGLRPTSKLTRLRWGDSESQGSSTTVRNSRRRTCPGETDQRERGPRCKSGGQAIYAEDKRRYVKPNRKKNYPRRYSLLPALRYRGQASVRNRSERFLESTHSLSFFASVPNTGNRRKNENLVATSGSHNPKLLCLKNWRREWERNSQATGDSRF
jgi:hypothetical protein